MCPCLLHLRPPDWPNWSVHVHEVSKSSSTLIFLLVRVQDQHHFVSVCHAYCQKRLLHTLQPCSRSCPGLCVVLFGIFNLLLVMCYIYDCFQIRARILPLCVLVCHLFSLTWLSDVTVVLPVLPVLQHEMWHAYATFFPAMLTSHFRKLSTGLLVSLKFGARGSCHPGKYCIHGSTPLPCTTQLFASCFLCTLIQMLCLMQPGDAAEQELRHRDGCVRVGRLDV
jgi:hypothetical protein